MMIARELHTPVRYPAWQREYETAILEVDPSKVQALITKAQAAIQARLESLTHEDRPAERDAIANALMFLRLLAHSGNQNKVSSLDCAA